MPVDDTDDDVSCATPLQVTLQDIVTSHEMIDVGVVHVPIEQIQIIQKLFEVYDFVKRHEAEGRKWTAHNESSVPQGTPSTSPQKRASHSTAPNYFEKIIALDEEERRRRKSEVTSAAPLASSKRKKSELESSVGSSSTIADIEEQNTISNLIQQLSALPPFDDIKDLFKAKIKAMEDWRQYQYLTLKEQEADTAASRKKTAHGNPIVYFSSIGVPLLYFANYIIGPFYESFFPVSESKDRLKHDTEEEDDDTPLTLDNLPLSIYQPQQARQVVKVFRLFQTLDSNSDGYVSWDDFSQFIVQTGERFLLHSDVVAESSGKAHSGAALSYPLQFIDRPTNRNAWQAQHPLVYYLYHTVPFHKFIASDRSKNYFTGSIDGLVKLWRPDPQLVDRNKKVAIVHERNLLSVPSPITDMCLSPIALGDSEVIAVSAMDGTISFIRATNGEVIRTMLGVRSSNEEQVRALGEIYSKRPGGVQKQRQEFEADDLLSLRQRPTAASGTVVRQPYTIPAYREEALEIFFGKVNRYFKSMEVLAPTYSHLKRPIATASDVLYSFGATHLSGRSGKGDQVDSWFASSVALGYVTPSTSSFQILKGGAYLFLGFETGTLMAYELNINWFSVSHLNATRVEPPTSRHPVYSTVAHESNISGIVISESNQFLLTISDDATVRIRNLNRIETPLVELGTVCLNDIPKQNLFDNEEV
ncbi:hypothetical protein AGDE_13409 [Angomonas deanei]|uniref:EF-hand domain-containing protein n=1 Tax=Angomonas deanei TaxID=59799 RepID=A0A7G2C7A4_9TRYP|nr:hypothetical protein AGDE_13409 [Angomonas deanei]CAD2214633.1 hypothetical protein, conserved [Angomonas deanei]|eukprot:EPY22405.1 hypothetical protein AGDE_13409 [Angomonas deanei]